ncbi:MAG: hypothetical protein Q4E20_09590 [Eubacteriales bacterium]|nr:hypothetical protein [Eubacteriales bacterium]
MKKKFWIAILTAVLLLNILPVMTPSAAADGTSSPVVNTTCRSCRTYGTFPVTGFIPTPISSTPDPVFHWTFYKCTFCGHESACSGYEDVYRHTGGTETPTCTTGKTCELCGAEYGKLGHVWGEFTSNGDGTHSRTCKRDGCGAVDTENCGGDGSATCVTPGTCTACGGQYYGGHYFGTPWKYGCDENTHWHACYYCENGKDAEGEHYFAQSNDPSLLKSPATCISKPVYYVSCAICYYKGTETFEYQWGDVDPKNHTGVTEVRGAVAADCTHDGYTGDTYCKDCDALLTPGTVIPATGHTGGTATCCCQATCEVCGQEYGGLDAWNHIAGCKPEWVATETTHEQKYSYCGMITAQKGEHTFGDWTVTEEAAAGKDGKQERVCTACGYTETEAIPAKTPETSPSPAPAPVATPEPTVEPVEQPSESGSAWWWIIILVVIAGTGTGIAIRQKKKDEE